MLSSKFDSILVFDFGGQYCHLIARRIRENGVYSEIVPCNITADEIKEMNNKFNIKGIILSGGPYSVYAKNAPKMDNKILLLGLPILGICYGHQLLAILFNGKVKKGKKREYGSTIVTIEKPSEILKNIPKEEKVWMSHYDIVYSLPDNFEILAKSNNCPIAAFLHKEKPIYGLQWHPEVRHTEHGGKILKNFIFNICKCNKKWKPSSIIDQSINEVRHIIGNKKAIIALSGGIDSSTAAIIASKAIGNNLTAVFVDHGLMREGEPDFVVKTFSELNVNIVKIDTRERFFNKLKGILDPEEKRKVIGEEFIRVFEEYAEKIGSEYLIQGTIYPDRIESGIRKHSEKIKSHHNVAGIPTKIKFKSIIEPLKNLYKDEVREIARSMGLPESIVNRQPFPGPGLAIRIIGEVTPDLANLLRKADKIVTEEFENKKYLKKRLWQYFAIIMNIKSTGIKGDMRSYGYILAIRAVESQEAMTASFARVPYKILDDISTRLTNELPRVTRVVYDVTHKPPATIEWE